MREVDFFRLSRSAQDRFVACAQRSEEPFPIATRAERPRTWAIWVAVAVIAFFVAVVILRRGFGVLGSPGAVQTVGLCALEAAFLALATLAALQALALLQATRALPFSAAVYLFPCGVIDARRDLLRVHALDELEVEVGGRRELVLRAGSEQFAFASVEPRLMREHLSDACTHLVAVRRRDPKDLTELDPLEEPRFSSPLAPTRSLTRDRPAWAQARVFIALVVGGVAGVLAWRARNVASDERIFAVARLQDEVEGYRLYVSHGFRHRDEVARTLLPRAELKRVVAQGTVEAIEQYARAHRDSAIRDEIDDAERRAMRAALERATEPRTLSALDAFVAAHPEHHLDVELQRATDAIFAAALERYRANAAPDPGGKNLAFVRALLAFAEKKGRLVEVRFRRIPSLTLHRADQAAARNPAFRGARSYPSRHFDAEHVAPQEDAFVATIVAPFARVFPPEILSVTRGASLDVDVNRAAFVAPTIAVSWSAEWSGKAFQSRKPLGIFVGIGFVYEVIFSVPGDTAPLRLRLDIARPVPVDSLGALSKEPQVEEKVYQTMVRESFARLGAKWNAKLFAEGGER